MPMLFSVLIILEMLCVNLYISHICFERKAPLTLVVPVIFGFTLLCAVGSICIANLLAYGEGQFMILGFFYVIPMNFLYRRGIKTTISVMCLSWSYTMLVFLLAKALSRLLPENEQMLTELIVQTVLYVLTLRLFLRMLYNKLLYVIGHAQSDQNYLFRLSVSTCAVAFCANWTLQEEGALVAKLVLVCVLAVNTVIMYHTLYHITKVQHSAVQSRQESVTDALTGLGNRRAFFEKAELLVGERCPFFLVFMDLDRFKTINDTYGHAAGDWYLRQFALGFTRQFAAQGVLYRIAGDEFVFLQEGTSWGDTTLGKIDGFSVRISDGDIPFLGFSCGAAAFPADAGGLDELLAVADSRMYQAKAKKKAAAKGPL